MERDVPMHAAMMADVAADARDVTGEAAPCSRLPGVRTPDRITARIHAADVTYRISSAND